MPPEPVASTKLLPSAVVWGLVLAAVAIPLSLLWDYSWESTVGLDYPWAPPHFAGYLAVLAAAVLSGYVCLRPAGRKPVDTYLVLWGCVAFLTAIIFERWWVANYGLIAGIWHPPQLLKAAAFFAILLGAWACAVGRRVAFHVAAGAVLTMLWMVMLAGSFANRQHSAAFYQAACATYPAVHTAAAIAGRGRFSAVSAASAYMLYGAAMVWLLPAVLGAPLVGPIFQPRHHLLPPPFPLLLFVPALLVDLLLRGRENGGWRSALEVGLLFAITFIGVQWIFAGFLLSPAAGNRVFGGGGHEWPVFLQIDDSSKRAFWLTPENALTPLRAGVALAAAILSARMGMWLGQGMKLLAR